MSIRKGTIKKKFTFESFSLEVGTPMWSAGFYPESTDPFGNQRIAISTPPSKEELAELTREINMYCLEKGYLVRGHKSYNVPAKNIRWDPVEN